MTVCPGYVKTGFQQHVLAGRPPEKVLQGKKFAITAAAVRRPSLRGVERNARTVVTPASGWLLMLAERLLPSFVEARMMKIYREPGRVILKLKQTPGLYVVGFMGAGKTTIGRLLAGSWDGALPIWTKISKPSAASIREIFDTRRRGIPANGKRGAAGPRARDRARDADGAGARRRRVGAAGEISN